MSLEEIRAILMEMKIDENEKLMYFRTEPFKVVPRQRCKALEKAIELIDRELGNEE